MNKQKLLPREVVEGMIEMILKKYSYLSIKQDEFEQAISIFKSKIGEVNKYSELIKLPVNALSNLKNVHIRVIDGEGNLCSIYYNCGVKNYSSIVTDAYLSDIQKSGPITLGKLDDIFYIGINNFVNYEKEHFDWLYHRDPPSEKNFILDLRANRGGNDSLGRFRTSFMLGKEGPLVSSYLKFRTDEANLSEL